MPPLDGTSSAGGKGVMHRILSREECAPIAQGKIRYCIQRPSPAWCSSRVGAYGVESGKGEFWQSAGLCIGVDGLMTTCEALIA
jgi:hypothetical protein